MHTVIFLRPASPSFLIHSHLWASTGRLQSADALWLSREIWSHLRGPSSNSPTASPYFNPQLPFPSTLDDVWSRILLAQLRGFVIVSKRTQVAMPKRESFFRLPSEPTLEVQGGREVPKAQKNNVQVDNNDGPMAR